MASCLNSTKETLLTRYDDLNYNALVSWLKNDIQCWLKNDIQCCHLHMTDQTVSTGCQPLIYMNIANKLNSCVL